MKIFQLFVFLFLLGQRNDYPYSAIIDTSKGTVMINQCSRGVPLKNPSFFLPTQEQIDELESNLFKIKKLKAKGCCFSKIKIEKDLENYGYQYLGVIQQNQQYIYVNAFYVSSKDHLIMWYKDWQTEPIVMCDGGDHYWGALYDLEKKKFKNLNINGII